MIGKLFVLRELFALQIAIRQEQHYEQHKFHYVGLLIIYSQNLRRHKIVAGLGTHPSAIVQRIVVE